MKQAIRRLGVFHDKYTHSGYQPLLRKGLRKYYPSKLVENTLNGARRDGLQLLTERELDVLSELRKGLTNGEISNKLFITEGLRRSILAV